MSDTSLSKAPVTLPADRRTRRLSITALTNRSIADRRERDLRELAGDDGEYLVEDLVTATTSEVAAQLLLTEHLLGEGWAFQDILRSVWYRDEALREAALRD